MVICCTPSPPMVTTMPDASLLMFTHLSQSRVNGVSAFRVS
jgi:hypothetical protein